jgi:tripartite-type tricarboxylate transporter receptor subunit TctC
MRDAPRPLNQLQRRQWLAATLALLAAGRVRRRRPGLPSPSSWWWRRHPAARPTTSAASWPKNCSAAGPAHRHRQPPGAGGQLAAEFVARAAPDGHVLLMSFAGNATAQTLIPRAGLDFNRDFTHVTQMMAGANVLVAHPSTGCARSRTSSPAKANPGKLSYASSGNGTSGHLAMELLKQRAGLSLVHIPYRGGAPALNDLLAGQTQVMFLNTDAVLQHVRSGRLNGLAISSPQRSPLLPDLPTVAEQGYPGYEATAWGGLSGPRGLPPAVVERLHGAVLKVLRGPFRARQEALGGTILGTTPAEFTAFFKTEVDRWARSSPPPASRRIEMTHTASIGDAAARQRPGAARRATGLRGPRHAGARRPQRRAGDTRLHQRAVDAVTGPPHGRRLVGAAAGPGPAAGHRPFLHRLQQHAGLGLRQHRAVVHQRRHRQALGAGLSAHHAGRHRAGAAASCCNSWVCNTCARWWGRRTAASRRCNGRWTTRTRSTPAAWWCRACTARRAWTPTVGARQVQPTTPTGTTAGTTATTGIRQRLFDLRVQTLRSYGLERLYEDRHPDPAERQQAMARTARDWADRFDPNSMVVLADAGSRFDVRPRMARHPRPAAAGAVHHRRHLSARATRPARC